MATGKDTGVASILPWEFANVFCQSGYADATGQQSYKCVNGPITSVKTSSTGGQCVANYTKADGSVGSVKNTFLCGYNADSNFYCPWS